MEITKTFLVIQKLGEGDIKGAVAIAKDFKIGFTKEENSIITRAHEMQWSPGFYRALGFDPFEEMGKAGKLLNKKYEGDLK